MAASSTAIDAAVASARRIDLARTVASAVVIVGAFGPWVRSGSSRRSSFELLSLVGRLGFAEQSLFATAVRVWPFMPLLVVGAVVAGWMQRRITADIMSGIAALYVGSVAVATRRAPDATLLGTGWGATVALIGAGGLVVAAVAATWVRISNARHPVRPSPGAGVPRRRS